MRGTYNTYIKTFSEKTLKCFELAANIDKKLIKHNKDKYKKINSEKIFKSKLY